MIIKLTFIWLFLLLSLWSFCNTFYVSPLGNDNNSGLSLLQSFRTLQKAANTVVAGDSVLISDSTYAGFDIRTSGTAINPIVFFATGNQVIINRRNSITTDGINIENADWIEIRGFRVINQPRAGIRVVLADHISIRYNTCLNNSRWGIFTGFTDDFLAEFNECAYSVIEHGIYVSNSSDRAIIRNNISHHNRAAGLHFNGDLSQGEDGINHNPQVYNNIIYRNGLGGGSAINLDGNQNALIYNNLIYNNYSTGIALYQIDGGTPSLNAKIYHNTIVQDDTSRWCILVVDGSTGATIRNNILINQHSYRGAISIDQASLTGFSSDYNITSNRFTLDDGDSILDSSGWKALGQDIHSFFSPSLSNLFINFSAADLKLANLSKAKNFGVNGLNPVINTDLLGAPRSAGPAPDAGAYESASGPLSLHWTSTAVLLRNNRIEISGTLGDANQVLHVLLEAWNIDFGRFDRLEAKPNLINSPISKWSFLIPASSGFQTFRLTAVCLNGESYSSKILKLAPRISPVQFFPNPAKDIIYFKGLEKSGPFTIYILDVNGRSIKSILNPTLSLPIHMLPIGQYRLVLRQGQTILGESWFQKF